MKKILPENKLKELIEAEERKSSTLQFCFAYWKDLEEAYAFYCARYENISFEDFLELPLSDFNKKIASIPDNEPLYRIMKARSIRLDKIKDKSEKEYWTEMKRLNRIPSAIYDNKSTQVVNFGGII